ncbi:NADH-quinone oxidoreductase subunit N [Methylacidimicrobium tartarophylax]|uniref:NADH-quinone oxidoreductase subunit N n=1 Tax=Methylacidimicrobium tartarophylax TaxID=1041768 RepID=A0A5E6MG96_9BACT|nr:NADH-quinone oxidoreductase subunit N [Methylacidimicrobium tartarophylax]VVM08032.1 NADH-quinone oxidoreductase subunit N [Methylacidimicrobium tartarophylax]
MQEGLWIIGAPEVTLAVGGVLLLLAESVTKLQPRAVGVLVLGVYLIAGLCLLPFAMSGAVLWGGIYTWDRFAVSGKAFFLLTGMLVTYLSLEGEGEVPAARAEFYILPLFCTAGMALLCSVRDFVLLFVALELVTVTLLVLVAYRRSDTASLEAGAKYLIVGGLATAFLVMGIAYLFGATGSTQFDGVARYAEKEGVGPVLILGLAFLLVGLGFKAAAVPFHIWAPDVYQGAPTPITAYLSVGSKAAGFVVLLRVLLLPFWNTDFQRHWVPLIVLMAAFSVVLGNLAALPQRNMKRLLGYSSISHAGFLLIGLASHSFLGFASMLYYLLAYLVATFTAFLVLVLLEREKEGKTITDLSGLVQRSPLLAWSMALAMISLAGLPPLMGFFGKLLVFLAAWESGFHALVMIGVAAAAAGIYYYISVVRAMFWSDPVHQAPIVVHPATQGLLMALNVGSVLFGFYAKPILALAAGAVSGIGG